LDIDVAWVDDGTRDFPDARKYHLKKILDELNSRGLKYVLVSCDGDYNLRTIQAINEIKKL
jgi:nicotinamide riboside kinase